MNITDIYIDDRVLVQTSESVKEVARVLDVDDDKRIAVIKLSGGQVVEIRDQYILKVLGI